MMYLRPTRSRRSATAFLAVCQAAWLAIWLAANSPAPAATAQEVPGQEVPGQESPAPESPNECAQPAYAEAAPAPTAQQADYRARLHSLATGKGITVAVIDTGVGEHPELKQVSAGPDLLDTSNPNSRRDCDIHGTVVAGIIAGTTAGIAPDASLVSIRQTSAYEGIGRRENPTPGMPQPGTLGSLAAAIDAAVEARARVINISVVSCIPPQLAAQLDTSTLDAALNRAEAAGAVIVAAAGNIGGDCQPGAVVYPAHASTVIAVGALDAPGVVAEYSLPQPDSATNVFVSAPGTVPLALAGGSGNNEPRWASGYFPPRSAGGEPAGFAGTSFAVPVVSATVALLAQRHPEASPAQLRALIQQSAQAHHGTIDPLTSISQVDAKYRTDSARPVRLETAVAATNPAPARLGWLVLGLCVLGFVTAHGYALRGHRR